MEYEKTVLGNGLTVVSSNMPYTNSVSVAVFISAGSCYEPKPINGVSHFIEHMLFKGTEKRPTAKDVSEAIESIGGVFNAETGKEVTVYWTKVAKTHWGLSADVLADIILHSKFEPNEIEKERKVIIEELNMLTDTPQDWVHVLFDDTIWGDQPIGRDVGGTRDTVSAVTRDEMLAYMQLRYAPNNTVVSVAGALTHDEVVREIDSLLGAWVTEGAPAVEGTVQVADVPQVRLQPKRTEQAHLCLGFPGLSYHHPDRFSLDLLNVIMGEGMSSRLFLEIREKQGLAYDVHSYVNHYRDVGSTVVYAGVDPRRIDKAIQATLREIEKIKTHVPIEEISKAKEFWKGRLLLRLEDTRAVASWMGGQQLLLGQILTLDGVVRTIDQISEDGLLRVANESFPRNQVNLAVIGPFNKPDRFIKLVRQ
ncbi:MAG: insulinase family protein [Chloroflexi bacterium]|nr:insulinase family protein [Chloroflexota bacterium]